MGLDNPIHLAFIVLILLLVFGAKRLPEIGRSLGSGMREFKDSVSPGSQPSTLTPPGPQQPFAQSPPVAAPAETPVATPVQAPAEPQHQHQSQP